MNDDLEMTAGEECKIEDIADHLYKRVTEETEKILVSQLEKLGVKPGDIQAMPLVCKNLKKIIFPDDDKALAIYEYNGVKILGVKVSDNAMGIEFDIPNLETQEKGEVQNNV